MQKFVSFFVFTVLIFTLSLVTIYDAHAVTTGFQDDYDPSNWQLSNVNSDGYVLTAGAPSSIKIVGGDNQSGSPGNTDYTIKIPCNGVVKFNWSFDGEPVTDGTGPSYDPSGYIINGVFTQVTNDDGTEIQSGSVSETVSRGDTFGFRINTLDNVEGPGTFVQITNFEGPSYLAGDNDCNSTLPAPQPSLDTFSDETISITWNSVDAYPSVTDIFIFWSSDNFVSDFHDGLVGCVGDGCVPPTSYVLTNLTPSTTYYIKLRASNGIDVSDYSNVLVVTTAQDHLPPPQPSLYTFSDETISITWNSVDAYPSVTDIFIFWSSDNFVSDFHDGLVGCVGDGCVPPTSYVLTNLTPSTTYYIKLRASNGIDVSDYSNVLVVTTAQDDTPPEAIKPQSQQKIDAQKYLDSLLAYQSVNNFVSGATSGFTLLSLGSCFFTVGVGCVVSVISFVTSEIIDNEINDLIPQVQRVIADPPRTDFMEKIVLPPPSNIPPLGSSEVEIQNAEIINALIDSVPLFDAYITSIERYEGAMLAEQPEYAMAQAKEVQKFLDLLINNQNRLNEALETVSTIFNDNESQLNTNLEIFQTRILLNNFNDDEIQALQNSGFNSEQIDELRAKLLSLNSEDMTQLTQSMKELGSSTEKFIGTLTDYSLLLDSIVENMPSDIITAKLDDSVWATQYLIEQIHEMGLDKNTKSALLGPLKKISKILNDGNTSNDSSACVKLDEFISTLNSKYSSKKIDSRNYNILLNDANIIKQLLEC